MQYFGDYSYKWLKILIPVIREIQRITESKETHKEKIFQIKIFLFGAAEEVKEISNNWIESNIFAAAITTNTTSNTQCIQMPKYGMDFSINLN
jgi:hypothetical protein